jgi:hypothetical protein
MPKTKHPYDETINEKVERWAIASVQDGEPEQQIALISMLNAFSKAIDAPCDVEGLVSIALYAAFQQTDCLHDDAIKTVCAIADEDRAVEYDKKHRTAKKVA